MMNFCKSNIIYGCVVGSLDCRAIIPQIWILTGKAVWKEVVLENLFQKAEGVFKWFCYFQGKKISFRFSSSVLRFSNIILMSITGTLICTAAVCQALPSVSRDSGLVPLFDVQADEVANFVKSVGYVFSLRDLNRYFSDKPNEINFIFISQPLAILNRRIDTNNLEIFDDAAKREISKIETDNDECFVQTISTTNGRDITLAINTAGNGPMEVDKKCFLLGLAVFDKYNMNEIRNFNGANMSDITMSILDRANGWGN